MKTLITLITLIIPIIGFAHGDHAPKVAKCAKECTQEQIEKAVPAALDFLIEKDGLLKTWKSAKVEKVEKKKFKKSSEWVATLLDETQTDKTKQKLYVFITLKGTLNGANYTGE
jgi:hypothetical protein